MEQLMAFKLITAIRFKYYQVRNFEEISEFYGIYLFINGLKPKIKEIFDGWHQYSCTKVKDAISLALKIDSNGLQDSFSPFDSNSSFCNQDSEFHINITLGELMKDNEFFRSGMIQATIVELEDDEVDNHEEMSDALLYNDELDRSINNEYQEVEGFVRPFNKIQKNSFDETPETVFTSQHKDLVIEGEKWMKATAESYTITAALITTIVFAGAITVPGGNKDTRLPNFSSKAAFTVFAISDAISLFTAVTSLLMFLSILTTRFAEQDFLFKLPKRLIIGLATLFISTTAMIIAFGATLLLVFGQGNSWILLAIGALTCLPITSFVTLQFPLIVDLMSATYGRSIFVKRKYDDDFNIY